MRRRRPPFCCEVIHEAAFDVGRPYSVCVNPNGVRFVDEACGCDEFGKAMVADQLATGRNCPCWLVFDAGFRAKFTAEGFMPSAMMPDCKIPPDWRDHYIFRAESNEQLAAKLQLPAGALETTVSNISHYASAGTDPEFGRGGNAYDRMFGDPPVTSNPCLGPIETGPFYAVAINLGDLGTTGSLKVDARARA